MGSMYNSKGYAAQSATTPLAPFSFDRRDPGPHDVAIDILYCGVCHSDLHTARGEWGFTVYPSVPGHEIIGRVTAVGDHVGKFKEGDFVGVGCMVDSCQHCAPCKAGLEQYCEEGMTGTYNSKDRITGANTYGGYSDAITVRQEFVLSLPEGLDPAAAAPLLCAGITTWSPLKHWGAGPGKKVAVVGLGGLGHMGVKLAHALGAEGTVLSQSLRKQADGKRLGADHFYATSDPVTFSKLKNHFDLILNTVSADMDWNQLLELLKVDGSMVVVGLPEKNVPLSAQPLVAARRSVAGSQNGGIPETQEMLDFCGQHNIVSD